MGSIVKENPTKPTKALLLLVITLLIWLDVFGGVWSIFSSTPPFQWLHARGFTMTAELYWWLKLMLYLCMLGVLVWILIIIRQQKREVGFFDQQKTVPKEHLTAKQQALQFITDLKKEKTPIIPIKIVSTTEGQPLTRILVNAFHLADYEVLVNESTTDYFFLANTTHNKIIIRYQEASSLKDPDHADRALAYLIIIRALDRFIRIDAHQPFPSSSSINYLQIEVRGGL